MLDALILGLVQGLTEFIPVSSSGHLIVVGDVLNLSQSSFLLDVTLNIGTLAATLLYFRKDIYEIMLGIIRDRNYKFATLLIVATIPAAVFGLLLEDIAETMFRSTLLVAASLAIVGLLMLAVERVAKPIRPQEEMNKWESFKIGLAQSLALIPGTSRSGITMIAGIGQGFTRETAARFSFLLAIPVLGGGVLKVLLTGDSLSQIQGEFPVYAVGIATAFASGLAAIHFMLRYLRNHTLNLFAYYRIALAVGIIVVTVIS